MIFFLTRNFRSNFNFDKIITDELHADWSQDMVSCIINYKNNFLNWQTILHKVIVLQNDIHYTLNPLLITGFGTSINVDKRKLIITNKLKCTRLEFYPHKISHDGIIIDGQWQHYIWGNEGLQLMFKASDGSPACVKESNMEKLVQRGWGELA